MLSSFLYTSRCPYFVLSPIILTSAEVSLALSRISSMKFKFGTVNEYIFPVAFRTEPVDSSPKVKMTDTYIPLVEKVQTDERLQEPPDGGQGDKVSGLVEDRASWLL